MPEWWLVLLVVFVALIVLLAIGVPVAFAFLTINIVGVYVFWNGTAGFHQLVLSVSASVTHFSILPVPLFILMGEVMFRSGIASKQMDVLDSWFGRVPGRLSLMAVGGGTMFATLTGAGLAGPPVPGRGRRAVRPGGRPPRAGAARGEGAHDRGRTARACPHEIRSETGSEAARCTPAGIRGTHCGLRDVKLSSC